MLCIAIIGLALEIGGWGLNAEQNVLRCQPRTSHISLKMCDGWRQSVKAAGCQSRTTCTGIRGKFCPWAA